MGGDVAAIAAALVNWRFQSTPPARGATVPLASYIEKLGISIHAPREGGDTPLP